MTAEPWYRDRGALRFIALRYLPIFAVLSLAWEWAHVRLYTIWTEAQLSYIAFSVAHCTLGDVLIGTAGLVLALILARERRLNEWHGRRIAILSALIGVAYTAFSEWMNITILRAWKYAPAMPTLSIGDFELGLTPLAQWLVIPPLALYLALRSIRSATLRPG